MERAGKENAALLKDKREFEKQKAFLQVRACASRQAAPPPRVRVRIGGAGAHRKARACSLPVYMVANVAPCVQNLSQRAAGLTQELSKRDKEKDNDRARLAAAHQRMARLEAALHEASIKERRLKDELEPLRDDLCRLQEVGASGLRARGGSCW